MRERDVMRLFRFFFCFFSLSLPSPLPPPQEAEKTRAFETRVQAKEQARAPAARGGSRSRVLASECRD